MSTVLISFLGRSIKKEGSYRTTRYVMNGQEQQPTSYVGYLFSQHHQPDKLVILGTAGSMWDHLFEVNPNLDEEQAELCLQQAACLEADIENKTVNQAQLNELTPLLQDIFGCEVELVIIPAARTQPEQIQVLQHIAAATVGSNNLILDVTHSFRHLPMLAYTAILYLQTIQPSLNVKHILYGEYDHDEKKGEIHDLVGLVEISRWQDAIRQSEATGDYSLVSELVADKELGDWLSKASFYENAHRADQARGELRKVREKINQSPLTGPAKLFQPLLLERTSWVEEDKYYQRQRAQAYRSLERKDFLRAALYGFEAFITYKTQTTTGASANVQKYEVRKKTQDRLEKNRAYRHSKEGKAYIELRNIRNTLAHGIPNTEYGVQQAIHSTEQLNESLKSLLGTLLT